MTNHDIINYLNENNPNSGDMVKDLRATILQMNELGLVDIDKDGEITMTERGDEIFMEMLFGK